MSPCLSVSPIKTVFFPAVRAFRMKYRQLGVYLSVFGGVRQSHHSPRQIRFLLEIPITTSFRK